MVEDYAVIDSGTNVCVAVVVWDGQTEWEPPWPFPNGYYTVPMGSSEAGKGWTYDPNTGMWTPPPSSAPVIPDPSSAPEPL